MPKRFHLGWFVNFTAGAWDAAFSHGGSPWNGKFYVEFAQALERACFDYIMLEDTLMVSEAYRGTAEATLKYGLQVPKHDPVPLAAMIAGATSKVGVVATMSTMAWPPFMLARVATTIDHIAGGRFGWNIVTSGEDIAAQNFGLDRLPPRELRYAMADEYMELVYRLLDAWEPDAVMMDRERGIYADWRKVHPVHFEGEYFKCRGPLNTVPSPQRRPAFVQAGGSPRGRAFAARHADSSSRRPAVSPASRNTVTTSGATPSSSAAIRTTSRSCSWSIPFWARPTPRRATSTAAWSMNRPLSGGAGGDRHDLRHRLLAVQSG